MPQFMFHKKKRDCLTLEPGKSVVLDSRLDMIELKFDWSFKTELPENGFDVDSSVAMFSKTFQPHDFVWWDNVKTQCASVEFLSEDNQGTTGGEVIQMQLQEIPNNVHYLVVAVCVYSKDHDLQHLEHITLDVHANAEEHLIHYQAQLLTVLFDKVCFIDSCRDNWTERVAWLFCASERNVGVPCHVRSIVLQDHHRDHARAVQLGQCESHFIQAKDSQIGGSAACCWKGFDADGFQSAVKTFRSVSQNLCGQ